MLCNLVGLVNNHFKDILLDVKYAHEHSNDVVWLDRVPSSGYYWMVQMNAFGFRVNYLFHLFI
jgi:hypothetical protein